MAFARVGTVARAGLRTLLVRSPGQFRHSRTLAAGTLLTVSPFVHRAYTTSRPQWNETSASADQTAAAQGAEKTVGTSEKHQFQAETRQLLDIVAHSLYTDKEVFVRELVSNASDALEKVRFQQVSGKNISNPEISLEINIAADEATRTLTIHDHGVGMTKDELVQNLGTIARSGTKSFLNGLKSDGSAGDASGLIGQFGVGFYSVFMVADKVTVFSRSANPEEKAYCWTSDGSGTYDLAEADGAVRGTKIVVQLKPEFEEFAKAETIKGILLRYSNFVGFPVNLNGDRVNAIKPLWLTPKKDITDEMHKEFFQYIADSYASPLYNLHFTVDSPVDIKSLFYIPNSNPEKFGMAREDPGVSLYSRKVLIQPKSKELLPEWMRFVKGVVDSDDIPLSISRENMQDSQLMRRLNQVLTKRILKWIANEAKADEDKYIGTFYKEFGNSLKEGLFEPGSAAYRNDIAKLLRFETSAFEDGKMTSLEQYIERMGEDSQEIYFVTAPSRSYAEQSPYYEPFKRRGKEVIFLYQDVDEFCLNNLQSFEGKKLVSVEEGHKRLEPEAEEDKPSEESKMAPTEITEFTQWYMNTLQDKVDQVKSSTTVNSPVILVDHLSASERRLQKIIAAQNGLEGGLARHNIQVNPNHPTIIKLNELRTKDNALAALVAEQLLDNAVIAVGGMDDPRTMLDRIGKLVDHAMNK